MSFKPEKVALLLLLSGSLPLSAQPQTAAKLERFAELPIGRGVMSPDSKLIASYLGSSVGVWSLADGRQVHKIPFAFDGTLNTDDRVDISVEAISPDDRFLLLSFGHIFGLKRAELQLYLVSLDDERATPLPISWKSYCHQQPLHYPGDIEPWDCPWVAADFSPDGAAILARTFGYPSSSQPANGPDGGSDVFSNEATELNLKGKILHKTSEEFRWKLPKFFTERAAKDEDMVRPSPISQHPTGAGLAGFREDGLVVGVVQDESGCELRDLHSQKRLGFLDGCDARDNLHFDGHRSLVTGKAYWWVTSRTLKRWDLESGKRLAALPCEQCSASFGSGYAFVSYDDPVKNFEIRDASLETVLLSTSPANFYSYEASPDGSVVLAATTNGSGVLFRTGLSAEPASAPPAAEAVIDVDAVPASAVKTDPDAYAVVIGVERYRQDGIPVVDFAARDARAVYSYLTGAMGFDARNVVLLTDAQATRTDFDKNLKWLSNRATERSRVFVYYAGHGSPDPATGQGYLMPYEADPAYLDETAFPLARLYAALGKLPTKDVTVVLDACFSGQGQRSLIAKGTRPLVNAVQSRAEPNTLVLAAAASNQVSASFPAARHGLLTYYLLAGLRGGADTRGDGRIDAAELYGYVRPAVERGAKLQNVEQTPLLMASPEASARPWIVLKHSR